MSFFRAIIGNFWKRFLKKLTFFEKKYFGEIFLWKIKFFCEKSNFLWKIKIFFYGKNKSKVCSKFEQFSLFQFARINKKPVVSTYLHAIKHQVFGCHQLRCYYTCLLFRMSNIFKGQLFYRNNEYGFFLIILFKSHISPHVNISIFFHNLDDFYEIYEIF